LLLILSSAGATPGSPYDPREWYQGLCEWDWTFGHRSCIIVACTFGHESCTIAAVKKAIEPGIDEVLPALNLPGDGPISVIRRFEFQLSRERPVSGCVWEYEETRPWEADVHREFEVCVLLAGSQRRMWQTSSTPGQGLEHAMLPGSVELYSMWEAHACRVNTPGTKEFSVQFLADFLGDEKVGEISWLNLFTVPPTERPRVVDAETRHTVLTLANQMAREIEKKPQFWESAVRLELLHILLVLSRGWKPPGLGAQHRIGGSDLPQIIPALALVGATPDRRIPVEEAARLCGLSRGAFSAKFRRAMDVGFAEFSLRARLASVAHQVLSTERSIASIAAAAGFTDESHLIRRFAEHYGCTPGQYRRGAGGPVAPDS